MENPATWGPAEHAVRAAINRANLLTGFDHSGKTIEHRITAHLYHTGFLGQKNCEQAERLIGRKLRENGENLAAEHPVIGLSPVRMITDALREAGILRQQSEQMKIDRGEIKPRPVPPAF